MVGMINELNPELTQAGYKSIPIPPRPKVLTARQKDRIYLRQKNIMKQKLKDHKKSFLRKVQRCVRNKTLFETTLEKTRRKKREEEDERFEIMILNQNNISYSDLSDDELSE